MQESGPLEGPLNLAFVAVFERRQPIFDAVIMTCEKGHDVGYAVDTEREIFAHSFHLTAHLLQQPDRMIFRFIVHGHLLCLNICDLTEKIEAEPPRSVGSIWTREVKDSPGRAACKAAECGRRP